MPVILGIDPGSRICGYGLVSASGSRLEFVASGCIRVASLSFPERLHTIYTSLNELIDRYQPGCAAVEEVFMGRNPSSALKLGQARGAALVACTAQELAVHEYSASKIKQALAGSGGAKKAQVQHMVVSLLGLSATPQEDAADALSAAICHAHTQHSLVRMAGVRTSRKRRLIG